MITNETLDVLEQLANNASQGDWKLQVDDLIQNVDNPVDNLDSYAYISCEKAGKDTEIIECVGAWCGSEQELSDIRFIAAANPNMIKLLIQAVRDANNR